ncbi:hypothetical protein DKX38_018927 [Salix brachista]|uniref:Proteasome alpha-type subunits domain-containing protein n=1 Tax=Salix brachista TaxID=2182728 RepID=A0A5N5KPJ6_9ROSI|nr:hypothetical protein DKX38_018927 [Salix brachista]
MGDSQYSFSLITFSPTGKLVQIEHAMTAVRSGQTSLGIKAFELQKLVIVVEKQRGFYPMSGMGPDFRVFVRKSRKQAEQYHRLYKEPNPVTQLVREPDDVMQEFT